MIPSMRATSLLRPVIALLLLAAAALAFWSWAREHPEDLPWTELDLAHPVGAFTRQKLVSLTDEPGRCRTLLDRAGIAFSALDPREAGPSCGYADGVRPAEDRDPQAIAFRPADVTMSCPVAAALALWEWEVLQPAALELFGSEVAIVEHYGGYACRRMYGAETGRWSEHATADALDVAAFVLEDGTRIAVARDWHGEGPRAEFLRRAREGACDLFATVLSPDYNAAHADHFHLDQARRGSLGGGVCR